MSRLLGILALVLVLYGALMTSDENASSLINHQDIGRRIGFYGVITLGAGVLIISGGIDLSIGSVVGFGAVCFALFLERGWSPFASLALVLAMGAVIGLINGLLVTRLRLQPFLVTLCGLFVYRGLARWATWTEGGSSRNVGIIDYDLSLVVPISFLVLLLMSAILIIPLCRAVSFRQRHTILLLSLIEAGLLAGYWRFRYSLASIDVYIYLGNLRSMAVGFVAGVPLILLLMLAIAGVLAVLLHWSVYGRYLYAIGHNEQAARYAGIATERYKVMAYVICSLLAALGGVLLVLDVQSVNPASAGSWYELYAITGAVLGGCSLRGGEGSVPGILLGTAVLPLLRNLCIFAGVPSDLEFTIIGLALLVGTIVDEVLKRPGELGLFRFIVSRSSARTDKSDPGGKG